MADYQVVDREQLDADMTDVADRIRAKAEISTPLEWPDGYKAAVDAIQTGVELPDLTNPGDASKLLSGYQLIDGDGQVVDGKMPIVDAATPGVSVQANGDVVAYVDQAAGYTAGGYKTYKQSQDVVSAQTIMPGTEDQVIPAYHYLTGKQTIKGDPNLTPENIPEDLTLFGVQGERKLSNVEPPDSLALDPDVVYATTRPKDWLPMPTPGDDEIYLLGHIPEGLDGAFTATIKTFTTCTIEIGNLVDGAFVAKETITPAHNIRVYHTVYASDYGDITTEGCRQYLVKIKGDFKQALLYPETDTVFSYGMPMVVDAVIGVYADTRFGINTTHRNNCEYLRYARFVGNGALSNLTWATFRSCKSLLSISAERQCVPTSMNYFFEGASSLLAISENLLVNGATYSSAFKDCHIGALPRKRIKVTSCASMFYGCDIKEIDGRYIATSECTDFTYFARGTGARRVLNLDISNMTVANSVFLTAPVAQITFSGDTTPGGWTLDLTPAKMTHKALVEMINSLPTATAAATLTITGNPGASELTEAEIAVATAKNWTITI